MSSFPVPSERFWAKLHPRDKPVEWHPLIGHSADVAAVMQQLLSSDSSLSRRFAGALGQHQLTPAQTGRLVFLATLHDMGKTGHGFQSKARPNGERHRYTPEQQGHVQTLLHSTGYGPLKALILRELLPIASTDLRVAQELFLASIAHHGRPWQPKASSTNDKLWKPNDSRRDPLAEMRRLITYARQWSGLDDAPGEGFACLPPEFTHLFAGALTLADWIGSTRSAFPLAAWSDDEPDRYWIEKALPQAVDACARIGVVPRTTTVRYDGLPLLQAVFPATFAGSRYTPTELQSYAASGMPLPSPGTRLLIESETGSGKTEAALTLYARLRAAGQVGGLVFALPTRATAGAMYERVREALRGMYTGEDRPTLALAAGGQQPHAESNEPLIDERPQIWPDQPRETLERWASSHNKKFFAAEVVVGAVDQVLLGGLPVTHAHLRLAALSRHLLVVDELHSYDRYMSEILARVLELHTGVGGVALFMSATLSEGERQRYAGGPERSHAEAEALPYPTLSICARFGDGWRDRKMNPQGEPKTVRWKAVGEQDALQVAVAAATAGARVCILCNTVNRARATVAALRDAGHGSWLWRPPGAAPEHVPPYHSRYTLPDRRLLDEAVLARFGKGAAQELSGVILVSTQVVEQSLDVDFDLLVTDLCPIDVLLQRVGRLHRHRTRDSHRPDAYRTATVLVIPPEQGSFAPHLKRDALPLGWGKDRPYRNYLDGELTLRAVAAHPTIEIPRDNRRLIESVYHGELRDPFWEEAGVEDQGWPGYLVKAEGEELGDESHARSTALNFGISYSESAAAFAGAQEQRIRTRLGDETVRVELGGSVRCWYNPPERSVQFVDLPAWALPGGTADAVSEEPVQIETDEDGTRFRLGKRVYWYAPDGWNWSDAQA